MVETYKVREDVLVVVTTNKDPLGKEKPFPQTYTRDQIENMVKKAKEDLERYESWIEILNKKEAKRV